MPGQLKANKTAPEMGTLRTVQAARGVAALAVVLCHATTVLGFQSALKSPPIFDIFRFGHAGVDFFFVLSGFIIFTIHQSDIGRPQAFKPYAWKRLIRIYPAYWLATCVVLVLAAINLSSITGLKLNDIHAEWLLASGLLLPQHTAPILGVAWTLQHEVLFYLCFAVAIINLRAGIAVFSIWSIIIVGSTLWTPQGWPWAPTNLLYGFVGSAYHLDFFLGIFVAVLVKRAKLPAPLMFVLAGAAGILLGGALEDDGLIAFMGGASGAIFGISSAVMLAGLVGGEQQHKFQVSHFPVFVGSASYSIYLIHVPVIMTCTWLVAQAGAMKMAPGWVLFVCFSAIAVMIGMLAHVIVERPILRILRRAVLKSPSTNDALGLPKFG